MQNWHCHSNSWRAHTLEPYSVFQVLHDLIILPVHCQKELIHHVYGAVGQWECVFKVDDSLQDGLKGVQCSQVIRKLLSGLHVCLNAKAERRCIVVCVHVYTIQCKHGKCLAGSVLFNCPCGLFVCSH